MNILRVMVTLITVFLVVAVFGGVMPIDSAYASAPREDEDIKLEDILELEDIKLEDILELEDIELEDVLRLKRILRLQRLERILEDREDEDDD